MREKNRRALAAVLCVLSVLSVAMVPARRTSAQDDEEPWWRRWLGSGDDGWEEEPEEPGWEEPGVEQPTAAPEDDTRPVITLVSSQTELYTDDNPTGTAILVFTVTDYGFWEEGIDEESITVYTSSPSRTYKTNSRDSPVKKLSGYEDRYEWRRTYERKEESKVLDYHIGAADEAGHWAVEVQGKITIHGSGTGAESGTGGEDGHRLDPPARLDDWKGGLGKEWFYEWWTGRTVPLRYVVVYSDGSRCAYQRKHADVYSVMNYESDEPDIPAEEQEAYRDNAIWYFWYDSADYVGEDSADTTYVRGKNGDFYGFAWYWTNPPGVYATPMEDWGDQWANHGDYKYDWDRAWREDVRNPANPGYQAPGSGW